LALLVLGLVMGLLMAESCLRLLGISYPQLYTPDEHCASRLRPGVSGYWITEGRAAVGINSDGLRDGEHAIPKPAGTVRIAVLGDSFAEALQVAAEDTFWAVAERHLQGSEQHAGRQVEFVNFGVSGYGTAQQLQMLRHHVWKYTPDVVLLAFCHNDLDENSKELGGLETKPYFDLQGDQLVLDASFRHSLPYVTAQTAYEQSKARIVNGSYFLQLLKHAKMSWHRRRDPRRSEAPPAAQSAVDMVTDCHIYAEPQSPAELHAWELTERLTVEMADETSRHGAVFALVTVTTPLQTYPDPSVRADAPAKGVQDLFYVEKRLARLGKQHGFPVLTLGQPMQRYAEQNRVYLHGFSNTRLGTGHWNQQGHRVAGETIANWLSALLLKTEGPAAQER
jgi:hypothetical protein